MQFMKQSSEGRVGYFGLGVIVKEEDKSHFKVMSDL